MAAIAISALCGLSERAYGQSFNIDIDVMDGDPGIGNGAPSSSFGAAAGQPGYWNRLGTAGGDPQMILGLDGQQSPIVMTAVTTSSFSRIGYRFEGNTGNYALLLNDASAVAPLISGGTLRFRFEGLASGTYLLYTYAVNVGGQVINTPVYVSLANQPQTQVVTGPMPGNAFEYLVTHSIHEVDVQSGFLEVSIMQPPNQPHEMHVNGFQAVLVPETINWGALLAGCLVFFTIRRCNRTQ
jgi:hypothetical protein